MPVLRRAITDAFVRNLKPAPYPQDIADTLSPLRVKVSPSGHKSFYVWSRFGGALNPAARVIGSATVVKLAEAREIARDWIKLAKAGDDPKRVEKAKKAARAAERASTFGAVWGDYNRMALSRQRRGARVDREVSRAVLPAWRDKPLTEITRLDVVRAIEPIVERGALYQAANALSAISTFFGWVIDRGVYGLETSPADRLRASRLVGKLEPRQRVLTEDELFAFWRATGKLPYPAGPAYRLLLLTAARHNEILAARWPEIDLRNKLLVIPPERFKSNAEHRIPLSPEAMELIGRLPRWNTGDYLFSARDGAAPIHPSSKNKERLDRFMLRTLKAMARVRGQDPSRVTLAPFVIHDLRRTVRTHLAGLRVQDQVAEMVLGHGRRGLQRVYDQHSYEPEMREALDKWAEKLAALIMEVTSDLGGAAPCRVAKD